MGEPVASERPPLWRRPPGRLFHGVLAVAVLVLLWSVSTPASISNGVLVAALVLLAGQSVWTVRAVGFLTLWWRDRTRPGLVNFLLAPACGLVVLLTVQAEVPLRLRWLASRPAFEDAVAAALDAAGTADSAAALDEIGWVTVDGVGEGGWIGLYEIERVRCVGRGGVLFLEATGGGDFGGNGFAYLPEGPDELAPHAAGVDPTIRHLGGPWYAWAADVL
ncbi:MAG TPA: hypothetical protein VIL36_01685 [Acidimicrobiales bacterium]